MDWNDVRHFLALARSGSVRAAGTSLGVSHSTVARRVEALEAQLAARLFDRTRDGYVLTEAGNQMLPGAERIEKEMAALELGLLGQDERLAGDVSITCCDDYISHMLIRHMADFCRTYPDIELILTTDGRPFDLAKREADIAVRVKAVGSEPPEYLLGTKVAPVLVANYVARAHREKLDPEIKGSQPRWLCFEDRKLMAAQLSLTSYAHVPCWGSFGSVALLVQAALEGLGIVMMPAYIGDSEPGLVRLTQDDERHLADLWLLCHPDLRENARFRATRTSLRQMFKDNQEFFRGRTSAEAWPRNASPCREITPSAGAAKILG